MTYAIPSSIIRGGWQLAEGHQTREAAGDRVAPILDAIDAGFRVFDCADIYVGVEEALGRARALRPSTDLRVHTKCVPDRDRLAGVTPSELEAIVDRSRRRLGVDRLDLVQFHWWDYGVPGYLEALDALFELREAGAIGAVGLTNFDTGHLRAILARFDVASIQLPASLVDRRHEASMDPLCVAHGVARFAYGSLLGGFLGEAWLGAPEPAIDSLGNRSLVKYKLILDDWGGWERFQRLLAATAEVASAHRCSLARVAVEAVIAGGRATAVIAGLSPRSYRAQNAELAAPLLLDARDLERLWAWDSPLAGDVYELERTTDRHARIMKYDLNRARPDTRRGAGG
jgi:aryl-alcohol dehydrogenase-like predicted oxidoreductase